MTSAEIKLLFDQTMIESLVDAAPRAPSSHAVQDEAKHLFGKNSSYALMNNRVEYVVPAILVLSKDRKMLPARKNR